MMIRIARERLCTSSISWRRYSDIPISLVYFICVFLFCVVIRSHHCTGFTAVTSLSSSSLSSSFTDSATILSSSTLSSQSSDIISFDVLKGKRVLVVGGSGRVGGSVTTQLLKHGASVIVGGTNINHFEKSKQRWMKLFPQILFPSTTTTTTDDDVLSFRYVHREQTDTIYDVLKSDGTIDLVVHTAGPFQRKEISINGVLEACILYSKEHQQQQNERSSTNVSNSTTKIPYYIDVCDDYQTAIATRNKYSLQAIDYNVPCIISTGCWPGVSSLMAKVLIETIITQQKQQDNNKKNITSNDLQVDFSFFTAGSGGAGLTLLVATFLILSERALTYINHIPVLIQPMKQYHSQYFGNIVQNKDISHLNLLETSSIYNTYNISNITSYFGTAPNFWNALLGAMVQIIPSDILANEVLMKQLSIFSLPIVRLVDYFAGATNAMRVDVSIMNNDNHQDNNHDNNQRQQQQKLVGTAIYAHENLEPCVGECVIAFCCAILSSKKIVKPGIWFPEEAIPIQYVSNVLELASINAHTKEVQTIGNIPLLNHETVWGGIKRSKTTTLQTNDNVQQRVISSKQQQQQNHSMMEKIVYNS